MHINLILETEQRSASPVSLAFMLKIAGGTIIVGLVLWLIAMYSSYRNLEESVKQATAQRILTEPKHAAAKQLRADLILKSAKLKEIQSWRTTRVNWGQQLESLQAITPAMIQLSEIRVSQDILVRSNNIPARVFELRLAGKTGAARSESNVSEFQQSLFRQPPFDSLVESVSIPAGAFRQDPLSKTDRVFEIVCKLNPRSFE
jgi:hypothetical protein